MTQDQQRALAARLSKEAQARAKSENAKHTLTREETAALWHAVNWMDLCLRQTLEEPPSQEAMEKERNRLKLAKSGLRKVNALRKQGL